MEFQAYTTFQTRLPAKTSFMSAFDDIPSFEEAFDSESLRKFYQQQTTDFSSCCESPLQDDSIFEVETQASPLIKYLNKFDEEKTLFQSALNLNQIFDSAEVTGEAFPESFLKRDSFEPLYAKAIEGPAKQSPAKVPEVKKVFEMKGMLSVAMCNGVFTLKSQPNTIVTSPSIEIPAQKELSTFESLIQKKRIFKIERDVKPKCPTKAKAQGKNKQTKN